MSNIRDWNDAYVELKHRAQELRGFVELTHDTPDLARWPRTIGADVIAIASLVDPHVRRLQSDGIRRRWQSCMLDVWRHAIAAPGDTYAENRAFWSCLLTAFVYLASIEAPLPEQALWSSLLAQLGQVLALRNVGPKGDGPFKHFEGVKTFHDLYLAQLKHLRDTRGVDELAPEPGMPGAKKPIPRTTNADVVQLADYWSKQLASVKKVFGHESVAKAWKAAIVDIDQIARKGDPNAVYPKNNGFWRQLSATAVQVSVADEAPSEWDMFLDSLKGSVKDLPDNLKAGAKKVASGVADITGDIAHGVGKIANTAGKGLFAGFGTPLLIGGAALGLFLIARNKRAKAE
jgi:hypothetical protein